MKRYVFLVLTICLLSSCTTTESIENNENPPGNESMEIKVVGPETPMVAPSNNKQAMLAYNTGTRLLRQNRFNEAEKHLKEAIELDPLFVDAMDHLGMVYRRQNRLREAEEIYLRSIEINKENKVPYQNLAVVYRLQNRLDEAFELYKTLIQLDENDPEPYYGMGELYYSAGNYENAMSCFDKAIELYVNIKSPYVYDAFFYKGMIYYRINDYDNALKYLEEARKGNPNNETIERTISEIKNRKA